MEGDKERLGEAKHCLWFDKPYANPQLQWEVSLLCCAANPESFVNDYFLTNHSKVFVFPFQGFSTNSFQELWIFFLEIYSKKTWQNYSILKLTLAASVHSIWVSPSVSLELIAHKLIIKIPTTWLPWACWFVLINNWTSWAEFSLNSCEAVLISPGTQWLFGEEISTPMAATNVIKPR